MRALYVHYVRAAGEIHRWPRRRLRPIRSVASVTLHRRPMSGTPRHTTAQVRDLDGELFCFTPIIAAPTHYHAAETPRFAFPATRCVLCRRNAMGGRLKSTAPSRSAEHDGSRGQQPG